MATLTRTPRRRARAHTRTPTRGRPRGRPRGRTGGGATTRTTAAKKSAAYQKAWREFESRQAIVDDLKKQMSFIASQIPGAVSALVAARKSVDDIVAGERYAAAKNSFARKLHGAARRPLNSSQRPHNRLAGRLPPVRQSAYN